MNRSTLSLRLDTTSTNIIVKGYVYNYIKLDFRERLIITCSKSFGAVTGTLAAFVNTKAATEINCLNYYKDFIGDENYCMSKQFSFFILPDYSSQYEISCRYVESPEDDPPITVLTRLCKIKTFFVWIFRQT